ncbi:MAG: hypothetical protein SVV03_06045 [Candidatus Nanohaloarchaea archaeon]|nr:hypothetical protein [Candidatus Nanohaloarchaea archaeon]
MGSCQKCGQQLESGLVLGRPGDRPERLRKDPKELCAQHFKKELAHLGR